VNSQTVEPIYRVLGGRIERTRQKRGLTQEQLAARLVPPLKRVTVSNIERGKQRLLVHVLLEIARVLEWPVQELLAPAEPPGVTGDDDFVTKLSKELSPKDTKRVIRQLAAATSSTSESRRTHR
jgi:transcriptional regulator with XRE-family HTH domain